MGFSIVGFTSTDKVPGYVGEVKYGAGVSSASDIPVICLLVGNKLTTGTAVVDVDVVDITNASDADTAFGAGSELARMCYIALQVQGVQLKAIAAAEAGGATAATAAVTFTGTATSAGTFKFRIDGVSFEVGIANGDTVNAAAVATHTAINALTQMPASSLVSPPAAVTTFTRKSKGVRGNQGTIVLDSTAAPTGMTAAITVGSAMSGTGRFRFTGGTGTESPANVIASLTPRSDLFMGIAQNDQTNLTGAGLWRDFAGTRAGALEGRPVFVTFGLTDATQPTTVAQAVNDQLFALGWMKNGESHPSEIAAALAALRAVNYSADAGFNTAGKVLKGLKAQVNSADRLSRPALVSALNSGITPINTSIDDRVFVVRGINTRSLNGSNVDYNTLDWADAQVPQFVRLDLGAYWNGVFQPNNPRNADNPVEGDEPREIGVATPDLWENAVYNKLKTYEKGVNGSPPLIIDVDDPTLAVSAIYDKTAKRIMSQVPVRVAPGNYQIGVSVQQTV